MNKYILLIMLLVIIPTTLALNTTEQYQLELNNCYDNVRVKVVQERFANFTLHDCIESNISNLYNCECNNISFLQTQDIINKYNFIVEYEIAPNDTRQVSFNNIKFGDANKKKLLKFPKLNNLNFILGFVGICFFVVGLIIWFILKTIYNNKENEI